MPNTIKGLSKEEIKNLLMDDPDFAKILMGNKKSGKNRFKPKTKLKPTNNKNIIAHKKLNFDPNVQSINDPNIKPCEDPNCKECEKPIYDEPLTKGTLDRICKCIGINKKMAMYFEKYQDSNISKQELMYRISEIENE